MAVLLNRPFVPKLETVNDKDAYLCNFWRSIVADPDAVAAAADYPVNETDLHARHRWLVETGRDRVERLRTDPLAYDAQVAGWWVWGLQQEEGRRRNGTYLVLPALPVTGQVILPASNWRLTLRRACILSI